MMVAHRRGDEAYRTAREELRCATTGLHVGRGFDSLP